MAEAILTLSDRVTAEAPRDPLPAYPLALCYSGGAVALQGTVCVGADATNQVVLEDRFVSRFHSRLHSHGGRWLLEDLGSTNGTWLDGTRIAQAEIGAGSRIRAGAQELRHVSTAAPPLR